MKKADDGVFHSQQNVPSKNHLFGGTVHKICMLCMFRCAATILL